MAIQEAKAKEERAVQMMRWRKRRLQETQGYNHREEKAVEEKAVGEMPVEESAEE